MKTLIGCIVSVILLSSSASGGESGPPSGGKEILNGRTYWRFFVTRKPPMVTAEALKLAGKSGEAKAPPKLQNRHSSAPPPAAWPSADFDDHGWPRSRVKWIGPQMSSRAHTFRISMRGKFHVENPGSVSGLQLKINYRGGVVAYLNGKEVARKNIPAGEIKADTPAELYPNEAWVDSGGKAHSHRKKAPALRDRSLGPVKLESSLLRKGTNVLAVEIRRSDFHPVAMKWRDYGHPPTFERWTPVGVQRIVLSATGGGFTPNAARPAGVQVWVRDRNDYMTPDDYGDPTEALYPVRLVGARNGSYCGQIGVGSDAALKGVKVTPSALKGPGGEIPAENVTVLYGLFGDKRKPWCDNLIDTPPAEVPARTIPGSPARRGAPAVPAEKVGAVQPVLIRVKVPEEAKPGEYKGSVSVAAGGKTVSVPVVLGVADWTVPDPRDFRLYVDLYQSPESVAMQYEAKMWSEEHWKLMEKSWELLGRAGNKLVLVNAAMETQFGNPQSTIYLVKKPGGGWDYDFTNFDRLMNMALKHCGQIDHVGLQVWHVGNIKKTGSGWGASPLDQTVELTVKDPKTGAFSRYKVPKFDTEESKEFWKPYLAAVDARVRKLGLKDALCVGILMDSLPSKDLFKTFDEIWPGGGKSRWMRGCHVSTSATRPSPPHKRSSDGLIVLQEYCYGGGVRNPKFSEARNYPGVYYFRASNENRVALSMYLAFGDFALWKGTKGVGRICLDYWPVLGKDQGKPDGKIRGTLINRYPYSDCMQRRPTIIHMAWPGPKGAMPTMRLEAFIEGIQASEAVIVIAEAVEKHRAKLGDELAAKCEKLLADRSKARLLAWSQHTNRSYGNVVLHPTSQGWQELLRRTYQLAAEVTAKIK
ncbi:MAG: glycoside hydrolase domain-containing protein [Planctomycetota bacterium]|jgi:hypothetical protein